ncbi:MAG: hypothetical protein JO142_13130, partial [Burkholderiales bacterium]|nr:hypothetical protein [Burkholderiales bacterium]
MPIVDQIAAANGVNNILNRQQTKQAGLIKELASGEKPSSISKALATPFETESLTIPVVQKNIALATSVLSASDQALKSVSANLMQAETVASQALSAPESVKSALAQQFNALLEQTKSFVDDATVNGHNLIGSNSHPMSINTTTEGGVLTVQSQQADAKALAVKEADLTSFGTDAQISAAINQIRNALNQITSLQSKFAAAQAALAAASQVNETAALAASSSAAVLASADIGAVVLEAKKEQVLSEFSAFAATEKMAP